MKIITAVLTAVISIIFIVNLSSQEFTYVGAGKCKICHKSEKQGNQFLIWEESKHSKSFLALTSEEVKAETPNASENPKCLECHSPLFEKAPEVKEEGITCEVCHGPGSAYKKLSIMKNQEEAVKNGLIVFDSPESVKAQCMKCHEDSHDKPFDGEAAWEKIKHPKPEKK